MGKNREDHRILEANEYQGMIPSQVKDGATHIWKEEIFLGMVNGVNWKSRNFTITSQKMAVPVTFFPLRM